MDIGMNEKLSDLKSEMKTGLQSMDFNVKELGDIVSASKEKTEENRKLIDARTEVTDGLKTRSTVHGLRLTELEQKIEMLERDKRRNIIIVEGVIESRDKTSPEVIED